jgi:hypothetical protein
LGFVERDVGDVLLGGGEVDDGLGGRMVTPRAYGVEVGDEVEGETGGESFAVELLGEAVGEVLKHGERDEDGVAGGPEIGLVAEDAELQGEMRALTFDGGVDAGGVEGEPVELVGRQDGDGAVGGGADLESALGAVVGEESRAEDFGEGAGGMAAEGLHLPETVLRGDVALGDDEVVHRGGAEVRHALAVALDRDGSGEAGDGESAVELGERVAHGLVDPVAAVEEGCDGDDDDESGEDGKRSGEDATALSLERSERVGCGKRSVGRGAVGEQERVVWRGLGVHIQFEV